MNERASHFAVVFAACAACHEAVAEIYQAAERYEWKENGLLQADAMSASSLFFEDTPVPYMGAQGHVGFVQEDGVFKISSLEVNRFPKLTVFDRYRALASDFTPPGNDGFRPLDPAAGMDRYVVR
jgi:hypothetical protein